MFTLFIVNICVSAWHFIDRAIEKETLFFIQSFIQDFELSFDFFRQVIIASGSYIPIKSALILLINIILLCSLMRFSHKVKKTLQ